MNPINSYNSPYARFTTPTLPASYGSPVFGGGQVSVNFQGWMQASGSLGQGWSGFAGGAFAGAGYQTMGGYPTAFGGLGQRFGVGAGAGYGGYGANAYPPSPFDPNCPPGQGWNHGAMYGQLGLEFGYQQIPGEQQKMWDVWFDSKDGQKTVQRSPIVLDLNGNGQADITGKNITGDGKIDGPTTMFDLDPDNISYEFKSEQRRPGSGAPSVSGGYWINADGEKIKGSVPKGKQPKYNGYQYMDKNGKLVGEMKDGLYHYGKQETREKTEWLKKNGGDGFLVADLNGDGQINSAVELFGTEGANGEKYQNGFEKLAALHDKNRDGKVSGAELAGLQVWKDTNADGKVQEGELQSLQEHNLTSFDVSNYNRETMEGSSTVGGGVAPYFRLSANLFGGYGSYGPPNVGYGYPTANYGFSGAGFGYANSGFGY